MGNRAVVAVRGNAMTRSEYMARKDPNAHREYMAQFVTPRVTQTVLRCIGRDHILASADPHMNDIPLVIWDRAIGWKDTPGGGRVSDTLGVGDALRAAGDYVSCGTLVCIMKEAARQIKESAEPPAPAIQSWRPEVQTDNTGKWYGNALRFATEAEALASAAELAGRWLAVRDWRAAPSSDPVTHRIADPDGAPGRIVDIRTETAMQTNGGSVTL